MSDDKWMSVADYSDRASAEAIVCLLSAAKVPCFIVSDEALPGLGSDFSVRVPPDLFHRARWVLAQSQVSEAELTYLATGELPDSLNGE
jgi:hypothetical protein